MRFILSCREYNFYKNINEFCHCDPRFIGEKLKIRQSFWRAISSILCRLLRRPDILLKNIYLIIGTPRKDSLLLLFGLDSNINFKTLLFILFFINDKTLEKHRIQSLNRYFPQPLRPLRARCAFRPYHRCVSAPFE